MAKNFLSSENTDVLWEVLADDDSVPKTRETQETFVWLLPRFHASHQKSNIDLMNMNKLFIGEMMEKLQENIIKTSPQKNVPQQLITAEDLKSERLSEFDKELKLKESDFQNAMKLPIPEEPNFKDDIQEKPLGDVSQEIERMMKERNLEINSIQKNQNLKKAEEWLSSTNSSLRNKTTQDNNDQNKQEFKFIKIEKDELGIKVPTTDLNEDSFKKPIVSETNITKNVSWDENLTINLSKTPSPLPTDKNESVSIFSKLKPSNEIKSVSKPEISSSSLNPMINKNFSENQENDMDKLFSFFNRRFDELEKKIDRLIPRPHPILMETLLNDFSDNSELGDISDES